MMEIFATALDQQYDAVFWMGTSTLDVVNAYTNAFMIVLGNPANTVETWALNNAAPRIGPSTSIATNTVHRLALVGNTASNAALSFYLNEALVGTGTNGAGSYLANIVEFGTDVNNDNAVNVRNAHAVILNRQLTLTEIQDYGRMSFAERALGAWGAWTLYNDAGGLQDWSGNERHLVETGAVTVEDLDMATAFDVISGEEGNDASPVPGGPGVRYVSDVLGRRLMTPGGLVLVV